MGNPWLIRQCWDHLNGKESVPVSMEERMEFVMAFLQRVNVELPPPVALGKIKKIGGYFSKGFPGSAQLRTRIHGSHTTAELFAAIREHFNI